MATEHVKPETMLALAAVGVVIVGVLLSKSGGGSSYGYTAVSPSAATLNYNLETYRVQAQTTAQLAEIRAGDHKAALDAQTAQYQAQQSAALGRYQSDAAVTMNSTNTAALVRLGTGQQRAAVQIAETQAGADMHAADNALAAHTQETAVQQQNGILSFFGTLFGGIFSLIPVPH